MNTFFFQKVLFSCAKCMNLVLPRSGGNFGIQKRQVTDRRIKYYDWEYVSAA